MIASASTTDGRRAERVVRSPSALVSIALGLVASIPPEDPTPTPESRLPKLPPPPSKAEISDAETSEAAPALTAKPIPASELRLALGVALGGRAGFPTSVGMVELEAFAHLCAHDWVVAASARWVPYGWQLTGQSPGEQYSYQEVALGLGFGRRFRLSTTLVDVTVSPVLVSSTEDTGEGFDKDGGFKAQVRLNGALRFAVPVTRHWNAVAIVDAELDPFHLATPIRFDSESPPLPTWTLGLRFGASGDLL